MFMRAECGVLESFQYNRVNVQAMMYQLDYYFFRPSYEAPCFVCWILFFQKLQIKVSSLRHVAASQAVVTLVELA